MLFNAQPIKTPKRRKTVRPENRNCDSVEAFKRFRNVLMNCKYLPVHPCQPRSASNSICVWVQSHFFVSLLPLKLSSALVVRSSSSSSSVCATTSKGHVTHTVSREYEPSQGQRKAKRHAHGPARKPTSKLLTNVTKRLPVFDTPLPRSPGGVFGKLYFTVEDTAIDRRWEGRGKPSASRPCFVPTSPMLGKGWMTVFILCFSLVLRVCVCVSVREGVRMCVCLMWSFRIGKHVLYFPPDPLLIPSAATTAFDDRKAH